MATEVVERSDSKLTSKKSGYALVHGTFHVFRITRDNSIIFVANGDNWTELDGKSIRIDGKKGSFCGIVHYIGTVVGFLTAEVPLYRMRPGVIGISRITGRFSVEGLETLQGVEHVD